jgi:hypothetical protein
MPATSPEAKRRKWQRQERKRRQVREPQLCRRCATPFRRDDKGTTLHFCSLNCRMKRRGTRSPLELFRHRIETAAPRRFYFALKGDPCAYCGGPASEIDHIDPVPTGFGRRRPHGLTAESTDWTNLTSACGPCNFAKGRQSLLEFLAWPAGWLR